MNLINTPPYAHRIVGEYIYDVTKEDVLFYN